ncbi:ATP-binding protein [Desulfogranum marinum]|uniref:HAMP domain-containing sensor histidine kinase n=1 Tax=Desulfogranum marinum TaxID=453220 RepID=UPI00196240BC|nr:HAMP domain-containing sensor histidine kinase [Desulfogranum marinum]MBM9514757.1 HAMP domain-containing histidine kinase [Desulfogranum marinum]
MPKSYRVKFTLTLKIILFVILYVVGIVSVWFISKDDLQTAEIKFKMMEYAYQMDNIILEVRRYEKNFFLYQTTTALEENSKYVQQAEETANTVYDQMVYLKALPLIKELKKAIVAYRNTVRVLSDGQILEQEEYQKVVSTTRDLGQQMTEKSARLLEFERVQLSNIIRELKSQIATMTMVAICFGFLIPFFAFFGIFKPLRSIKKATAAIAKGRFKPVDVINTGDEMQQVMEAFNTMVYELERRQEQLVQSQKLSSIGTLTAGVAHQLNNPLNNISTSCQIAMDDCDNGNEALLSNMLDNIYQETLRARDVVKGLLEFSRSQDFKLRTAQLKDVVNRSVSLVNSQISGDISLVVTIPENLILPMDVQRMQEVFINIIMNAAQSIKQEGVITLSAEVDKTEKQVQIEIHDTGPGIPKEIQGRLFDPFYTTKEEGEGTGLGLSVAYGIIQQHRGKITVRSEPGQGASFFISLPLQEAVEQLS